MTHKKRPKDGCDLLPREITITKIILWEERNKDRSIFIDLFVTILGIVDRPSKIIELCDVYKLQIINSGRV